MRIRHVPPIAFAVVCLGIADPAVAAEAPRPVFCCEAENDLYRVLADCGMECPRYADPAAAILAASEGGGVLVLADDYPDFRTR